MSGLLEPLRPLSIAWNWQLGFDSFSGAILSLSMWTSVIFWTVDIFINLNTGVYIQGHLVHSRRAILKRYAGTWLALDLSIVAVDYINLVEDEANLQFVGFLRFGRLFRALRMLRLLKMTKLDRLRESKVDGSSGFGAEIMQNATSFSE